MNLFDKKYYILLLIAAVFFYPVCGQADDVDQKIEQIVKDFEQQIGDIESGKDYFFVIRSFFDTHTKKTSKRSENVTDTLFRTVRDRYLGRGNIAILNWMSETPLEIKVSSNADDIYYQQGMWEKKLVETIGTGFLVAGTTVAGAEFVEIHAELIAMETGKVLARSNKTLPLGPDDIVRVQKKIPAAAFGPENVVRAKKTPPSQQPSAAAAAPAATPTPAEIKTAPEAPGKEVALKPKDELKDLQHKVIEGVNFRYEGYVKDGKMHGQGTLFFKSGDKYEGQWRNDKKHGQGTYYFKNGDKWEGTYADNKKHGPGVYTWASGQSKKEVWADGKLVK